jgi:hypothetical protein
LYSRSYLAPAYMDTSLQDYIYPKEPILFYPFPENQWLALFRCYPRHIFDFFFIEVSIF